MQPFSSRLFRPSFLAACLGLLAAGCLLGACDRHSAAELPESYGHGSAHKEAFDRHEPDSRDGSRHFSDSKGVSPEVAHEDGSTEPTPKPGETAPAPLFPSSDH